MNNIEVQKAAKEIAKLQPGTHEVDSYPLVKLSKVRFVLAVVHHLGVVLTANQPTFTLNKIS